MNKYLEKITSRLLFCDHKYPLSTSLAFLGLSTLLNHRTSLLASKLSFIIGTVILLTLWLPSYTSLMNKDNTKK